MKARHTKFLRGLQQVRVVSSDNCCDWRRVIQKAVGTGVHVTGDYHHWHALLCDSSNFQKNHDSTHTFKVIMSNALGPQKAGTTNAAVLKPFMTVKKASTTVSEAAASSSTSSAEASTPVLEESSSASSSSATALPTQATTRENNSAAASFASQPPSSSGQLAQSTLLTTSASVSEQKEPESSTTRKLRPLEGCLTPKFRELARRMVGHFEKCLDFPPGVERNIRDRDGNVRCQS
jgi:hypothetical protein